MSEDEQTAATENDEQSQTDEQSEGSKPPVDEESLKEAKKEASAVEQRYEPGARPTVVVEGTDGTVAGTAFATDEDIEKHQSERDNQDDD